MRKVFMLYKQLNENVLSFLNSMLHMFPENHHIEQTKQIYEAIYNQNENSTNIFNMIYDSISRHANQEGISTTDVISRIMTVERKSCSSVRFLHNISFMKMYDNSDIKKRGGKTFVKNKLCTVCKSISVIAACGTNLSKFEDLAAGIVKKGKFNNPSQNPTAFYTQLGRILQENKETLESLANGMEGDENTEREMKSNLANVLRDPKLENHDIDIDSVLAGLTSLLPTA